MKKIKTMIGRYGKKLSLMIVSQGLAGMVNVRYRDLPGRYQIIEGLASKIS